MRHLLIGLLIAVAAAGITACGSGSQPAQPSATPAAATPSTPTATVDSFVGVWGTDTTDGTPVEPEMPDNTAVTIVSDGACRLIEFKAEKQPDSRTASIVFAATCANARLRGRGLGQMSNGVLVWKAEGIIALPSGRTCQFKFVEGNRAAPAGEGLLKVTYNGTVCDVAVSGTQIVKRR
jgi:hypothetical protein